MVRGEEAVLLVEDESSVRQLARRILGSAGYTVHEAENGVQGLEVYAAHGDAIDLVVTDIVMPELGGRPLVEQLHRERPELPVIYISGYTRESIDDLRDDRVGVTFLSKPFTPNDLTRKVRETLDAR